jgi:hypothetical protein
MLLSCYKHYREEYRPEMDERACIQGPVCESRNWGASTPQEDRLTPTPPTDSLFFE